MIVENNKNKVNQLKKSSSFLKVSGNHTANGNFLTLSLRNFFICCSNSAFLNLRFFHVLLSKLPINLFCSAIAHLNKFCSLFHWVVPFCNQFNKLCLSLRRNYSLKANFFKIIKSAKGVAWAHPFKFAGWNKCFLAGSFILSHLVDL